MRLTSSVWCGGLVVLASLAGSACSNDPPDGSANSSAHSGGAWASAAAAGTGVDSSAAGRDSTTSQPTSGGDAQLGGAAAVGGDASAGFATSGGSGGTSVAAGGTPDAGGGMGTGGATRIQSGTSLGGASKGGSASGGTIGTGGGNSIAGSNNGGTKALGGSGGSTGGTKAVGGSGGSSIGGTNAVGGSGGSTGGAATGGAATGGAATGGAATGGAATGGAATGGAATGGVATGGVATGGVATGGVATGGVATGGVATGGAGVGGGTGTGADGCSETLAKGLTINEIALFQSGKISVMKAGAAVPAKTDYADVIEGRQTQFRIYVTTDSGFASRQLSARLTLNGAATPYYSKQIISATSTEYSTTNSFQLVVPATEIKTGLKYSVQIVECATGSGTDHSPKFPSTSTATIATRKTGGMKITMIPVKANGITPTAADLTNLSAQAKPYLEAVYPTTTVQITTSTTAITGCGLTPALNSDTNTWSDCLDLVTNRRSADNPASEVYYLGIVTPAASASTFCPSGCIAGIGWVVDDASSLYSPMYRSTIAIGFSSPSSVLEIILSTLAHELGHNHGVAHSPGCSAGEPDPSFPTSYVVGGEAHIGWVGWDNRTPLSYLNPASTMDMMSYCEPPWPSDYVYDEFANRVAALNGSPMVLGAATTDWRTLKVVGGRVKWGEPLRSSSTPSNKTAVGVVADSAGNPLLEVTVYRIDIGGIDGAVYLIPEPAADWASIHIGSIVAMF
jgi:hypothetical protein